MTEQEAVNLTIKLWSFIRDNPTKRKTDWPEWDKDSPPIWEAKYKGETINSCCFLCHKYKYQCSKCPLNKNNEAYFLYNSFVNAQDIGDWGIAKLAAIQIIETLQRR